MNQTSRGKKKFSYLVDKSGRIIARLTADGWKFLTKQVGLPDPSGTVTKGKRKYETSTRYNINQSRYGWSGVCSPM